MPDCVAQVMSLTFSVKTTSGQPLPERS